MISTTAGRQIVQHACARSLQSGVRAGMTVAHARALRGRVSPTLIDHKPQDDLKGLYRLARWAERWSPVVHPDPPDGLLLDISGCEHLFGGERRMLAKLHKALGYLSLTARIAAASTIGTAWGAARFGPSARLLIDPGHEQAALSPLPVSALRLPWEVAEGLAEIGIHRVGELLALPRSAIPARYGTEVLARIDQALGQAPERVYRLPEHIRFVAVIDLPDGTTHIESVLAASRDALDRLTRLLTDRGQGLRRLNAIYDRIDGGQAVLTIRVSRATRCGRHLWSLLRPRLERIQMGFGIDRITMAAHAIAPIAQRQAAFVETDSAGGSDEATFAQVLDTIANRIGQDRILTPTMMASHRPERAFVLTASGDPLPTPTSSNPPALRPSLMVDPPEPIRITALWPDGPVARLWLRGIEHPVTACIGPERISGEWWKGSEPLRDYFRIQIDGGRWLWVFRTCGDWHLHGEWA
ncbi:MAG: DNA polymerase Y family protein [Phycisphaerales bacterium]|nr:DNA polymerase Y family protein [Phycisphaerales bacterium]